MSATELIIGLRKKQWPDADFRASHVVFKLDADLGSSIE